MTADDSRIPLVARGVEEPVAAALRAAIARLADRANVCNLVSIGDLANVLPTRALTDDEVRALMAALADHGLHLIEPDAAATLAGHRQA